MQEPYLFTYLLSVYKDRDFVYLLTNVPGASTGLGHSNCSINICPMNGIFFFLHKAGFVQDLH